MSQPSSPPPIERLLVRMLASSRFIMILAVLGGLLGAFLLLLVITWELMVDVWEAVTVHGSLRSGELKIILIESMDTYLVATVLFLISIGLYQLFINGDVPLPAWLQTHNVDDLEKRLAGMVIIVLSVIFLTEAVQWQGNQELLWYGLSIGTVIFAISIFLFQEGRANHKE